MLSILTYQAVNAFMKRWRTWADRIKSFSRFTGVTVIALSASGLN